MTFLQPFTPELWLSLAGLFLAISAFLMASYFFGTEQFIRPSSFLPGPSMLIIWGSWMSQGSWLDPKSFPSRIIFFISFLCGITIYTAYSAKLISFLSIPNIVQPFSSLQELLKMKKFKVGTMRGTAPFDKFFSAPNDSIYKRVHDELFEDEEDLPRTAIEGADRVRADPNYAFIWNTITMPNQGGCEFLEVIKLNSPENWCQVPFDLGATVIAMAWNPNLPHRHLFDYYMQKVIHPPCNLLLRNKYLHKLFRVKVCHQAVQ